MISSLDRQCSRRKKYFHGKITRDEAEQLLKPTESKDGLFLVLESTNFPGDYTLCVCFQSKVEHYRVIVKDNLEDRISGNLCFPISTYKHNFKNK